MLHKIQTYIHHHQLPLPPASIIVALSGGGDSVALLLILLELGYSPIAAHCNFHLRGEESDRDEEFVRQLCHRLQVQLFVRHFDTAQFAEDHHVSIEMAARQLRYEWFEELRKEQEATAIAVAHHADDNAETLLLNLTRGTGLHGLKGMLPQNGHIVRPLLGVRREELENFLANRQQNFVTDSTNAETQYKRNKIRHIVLPALRELNPAVDRCLADTAQRMAEAESLYQYALETLQKEICQTLPDGILISIKRLTSQPAARTLLHEFLSPFGFSAAGIAMIFRQLNQPSGALFPSRDYVATIHRGFLEVRPHPQQLQSKMLPSQGKLEISDRLTLEISEISRNDLPEIPKVCYKAALDADLLKGQLVIRSVRTGDRFQPFGMKGTKLVSDYLTDRHRSVIEKQGSLVVSDEKGIVWLVNERVAQRVAVTARTKRVKLLCLLS